MEILTTAIAPVDWRGDGLVLGFFSSGKEVLSLPESLAHFDQSVLGGTLAELIAEGEFKAEAGSSVGGRVGVPVPSAKCSWWV